MIRRLLQEINDEGQDWTSEMQTERSNTTTRDIEG